MEDIGTKNHDTIGGNYNIISYDKIIILQVLISPIEAAPVPSRFECGQWMKTKVWPPLKKMLTFTVMKEGVLGTALHLLGCLMAYLSAFTITYQVRTALIINFKTY